jgi:aryl-alcohol dehydrogenase-like predicted oxidoreductase
MKYTKLGRSGVVVSKIALGTMYFGDETPQDEAFAIIDAFVDAGGTLIDTANVYAKNASEAVIGRWLASRPNEITDTIVLATKGRSTDGPDVNDAGLSRRHLHRALHDSLRRLGVETVDLYQLHASDMHTPMEETLAFLDDAVNAGENSLCRPLEFHRLGASAFRLDGESDGHTASGDAAAAVQLALA